MGVEFTYVIPLSADTWQIDWREVVSDKDGNPVSTANWRATFRVIFIDEFRENGRVWDATRLPERSIAADDAPRQAACPPCPPANAVEKVLRDDGRP